MIYKNLVFEGGGAKSVAFCGALKYLEEKDRLKDVVGLAGSSSGAMTAGLVSVGYTCEEIENVYKTTNFNKFKDDSFGIIGDAIRLVRKYGIFKGDKFYDWYGEMLKNKIGNPDITFKEVYDNYNKILVVTGTNVNKRKVVYFNHENYPNIPIRLAVRISISLPILFRSVEFEGDQYVDGGLLDNYPIWYFNEETLGFKLVNDNEKRDSLITYNDEKINNIKDFAENIIESLLQQIERLHVKEDYWERTITINTLGVQTTDFDLDEIIKNKLIEEGYNETKKFFEN